LVQTCAKWANFIGLSYRRRLARVNIAPRRQDAYPNLDLAAVQVKSLEILEVLRIHMERGRSLEFLEILTSRDMRLNFSAFPP
jgi:hypothetical protein